MWRRLRWGLNDHAPFKKAVFDGRHGQFLTFRRLHAGRLRSLVNALISDKFFHGNNALLLNNRLIEVLAHRLQMELSKSLLASHAFEDYKFAQTH